MIWLFHQVSPSMYLEVGLLVIDITVPHTSESVWVQDLGMNVTSIFPGGGGKISRVNRTYVAYCPILADDPAMSIRGRLIF